MRTFIDSDFLLNNDTARQLYHETAEEMPIIDYHCHISPKEIAENKPLQSITKVWLGGDHYKWRVMRAAGMTEDKVTGNASDYEKFEAFAETMPQLIGNPIYHWSHLELKRGFGIDTILKPSTAKEIFEQCNAQLEIMTPLELMHHFHVETLCTTDDPCDDLRWHKQIAEDPALDVNVLPAFRPDNAVNIEKTVFVDYIGRLSEVSGRELKTAGDVADALKERIDFFHSMGCKAADHGLDYCMYADPSKADEAFAKRMAGETLTKEEADSYKTYICVECAKKYSELGMVMQLHFGCLRNTNKPMYAKLGADAGYDAVNPASGVENLAPLLNAFTENDGLPKVIVYSLNPADNTAVASINACFQGGGTAGKIQMGAAWWFNDQIKGMTAQLTDLANNGVLAQFVGMLTDSRSFLSYTRHEYFRRILCNLIGEWVESGQYPADMEYLKQMIANICYCNTKNYFGF